ncbi:molybdopterin molybdotransferase MoeA [Sphingobium sp. H39-3-25]|uniref:molybdopterin molybdotransferase MoeA n=1 Tax=Sphingobium arseniciresistens TaxID=3030834 RepID=UPI0023B8EF1F|nr:molybdopterin molybdotransferase MoeA [Sphingobium arseniciresistens]
MNLMPVAQAQERILSLAAPLPQEDAPIAECAGRWLASDVSALRSQPWADLSAMDGYAVRAADLPGPWRVIGESAAGGAYPPAIGAGEAVRIFTGAPLPPNGDCVVVQEDVRRDSDVATLTGDGPPSAGKHIRPAGSDFRAGQVLLAAGDLIGPAALSLAVLAGHGRLPVRRRPRIAIISTGDELVAAGAPVPPGKLPSSNAIMLRALLSTLPCDVIDMGIVGDELPALTEAFTAASKADVVVTTGGASVGDHDLVRPAFAAAGGTLDFWKIAMRPGKPLIAGTNGDSVLLGLPGNPVAAFVTGMLFLMPLVRHLAGASSPFPEARTAHLGEGMPPVTVRDDYVRGRREGDTVWPLPVQDSAATRMLAMADCLILRPANGWPVPAGESVTIIPLR